MIRVGASGLGFRAQGLDAPEGHQVGSRSEVFPRIQFYIRVHLAPCKGSHCVLHCSLHVGVFGAFLCASG